MISHDGLPESYRSDPILGPGVNYDSTANGGADTTDEPDNHFGLGSASYLSGQLPHPDQHPGIQAMEQQQQRQRVAQEAGAAATHAAGPEAIYPTDDRVF